MREILDHPWVKVLLIATAIAMCTFALRETAWITEPIAVALRDVLVPVAIGFAIAYVLTPIVDAIARQSGIRRLLAAGLLFGIASLVAALVLMLVVPAVVSQGATLLQRVFQGEVASEASPTGKGVAGVTLRKPLIEEELGRLEDWENKLKVRAHLAFSHGELASLGEVEGATAELRDFQERMLAVARAGAAPEQWPAAPKAVDPAAEANEFRWPSPPEAAVNEAAHALPEDTRGRWLARMRASAHAMAALMGVQIQALEAARAGSDSDPLAVRIRQLWQEQPDPARREQIQAFADSLQEADQRGQPGAHAVLVALRGESPLGARTLASVLASVDDAVHRSIQESGKNFGDWTWSGMLSVQSLFTIILDALLVPIYAFFLVLAMPRIRGAVRTYIPRRRREQTIRIIRDIELVVAAFFRGRLIICTLCALVAWLGFSLIGWFSAVSMPYAALFGIGIGVATTVPLSGLLLLLPAVLLTMHQPGATGMHALLVIGVYGIVQMLESVLVPLVMGREVELHPVVLIIALLLCGKLLGILGLILAVPIAATCRILAREFLWPRLLAWADGPVVAAPAAVIGTQGPLDPRP